MSLNTAHASGGVLIYNGEMILLYCDGVELVIEGNSAKDFGGTKKGKIYLTTHRMIFMNKSEKDPVQSFSFPFFSMTSLELEQPVFGANYIKGVVHAQAGGNWDGKATFKLKFFKGGAIEFGQAMLQAAKMANQNMPPQPPAYMPHQGPYYPAPPPAYMPPAGGVNGFVPPTHIFPDQPPANSVYTMDMPPPYPGIYPPPYAYPPGSQNYPQAGPTGLVGHPSGPVPPGFHVPNGTAASPPGGYPPASAAGGYPPAGNYPPASAAGGYPPAGNYPPASAAGGYQPAGNYPPASAAGNYPPASAPGGYPSAPGAYPSAPEGVPPPYMQQQNQGATGGTAQHSGAMQQPPYNESKSGVPPVYDFYQDPYNSRMFYTQQQQMNGYSQNSQGPPPPYSEADKKDQ